MGKIQQSSIAIIVVFFVLATLFYGIESQSSDPDETSFVIYDSGYGANTTQILNKGNVTYQDTGDVILNFRSIASNMQAGIANAQQQLISGNPVDILLGSYGLVTTLIMNVLFMILAVIAQGMNLVGALVYNLWNLPPPWGALGIIGTLLTTLVIVYLVFELISAYNKTRV